MILAIARTALMNIRRDRPALLLSFVVPVVFFSLFASIFGGSARRAGTPKVPLAVVDEDQTEVSKRLVTALQSEPSFSVQLAPETDSRQSTAYNAQSADAAVRDGKISVALIILPGFGATPISFGPPSGPPKLELLADTSDPIAPQIVRGMLQKVVMGSMPEVMAEHGAHEMERWSGGLTPQQQANIQQSIESLKKYGNRTTATGSATPASEDLVRLEVRDILGHNKQNPMIAYYAAGIGVMFLLFTASGAGGAILDENDSGTLDRVLASRVSMPALLLGKLLFLAALGFTQLLVMFVWGALVFKLDLWHHLAGFAIMAIPTAITASTFGLMLGAACRTRAQLGAFSTLIVLVISAIGGSMFPRFIMPEGLQKFGLIAFNTWAIEGFTKVFWREAPLASLWPQVSVLLGFALAFFLICRRLARRWEIA
jgi:ABC-2 type transport system permease protein